MLPRFTRPAVLVFAATPYLAAIGGCDCALGVPPFINVEVRDSLTGLPAAYGTLGVARRGAFLDTLQLVVAAPGDSASALTLVSAILQAGQYSVSVTKPGYAPWLDASLVLHNDPCEINSVVLQARLQPLP